MDAEVNVNPMLRYIKNGSMTSTHDYRSLTFMGGYLYGLRYLTTNAQIMAKIPLFGVTADVTTSITTIQYAKDVTNDGTYIYGVEERTGAASGTTSNLYRFSTTGTGTTLAANTINMRSVVYDPVNICLYIAAPFDLKIMKATGGGIGGDSSTFAMTDFITGITNQPGRLALNKGSTKLYFSTEANSKQIGAVALNAGVPSAATYYDIMAATGETTCFEYFDEIDAFLYAGPNVTNGAMFTLNGFAFDTTNITAASRIGQAVKLSDNSFVIPDTSTSANTSHVKYYDLTSENNRGSNYVSLTGSADTTFCVVTGVVIYSSGSANVAIKDGGSSGTIVVQVATSAAPSSQISFAEPIIMKTGAAYATITGTTQVNIFGR